MSVASDVETWQKYPFLENTRNKCRDSLDSGDDGKNLNSATVCSTPKEDGHVYKRRKLRTNVVVLSEDNVEASEDGDACHYNTSPVIHPSTVQEEELNGEEELNEDPKLTEDHIHSYDNENPSTSGQFDIHESIVPSSQYTYVRRMIPKPYQNIRNKLCIVLALPANLTNEKRRKTGRGSVPMKTEIKTAEVSASDAIGAEAHQECTAARDLCTSVLKGQELLAGDATDLCASLEVVGLTSNITRPCKVCGHVENTLKMLICDQCEEAFHVSCCDPELKNHMWYCQFCFKAKRKVSREKISSEGRVKKFKLGPRIGKEYQVEVQEWTGPAISDGSDYFDRPVEIDRNKNVSIWDPNSNQSVELFIGNWIQCREVIYSSSDYYDEGTVCGKWRRAPLFVVQTDKWDCSCCLPWDPVHADCAVPQELETEVVLEHLKLREMMRAKMESKQQVESSKQ